MSDESTTPAEQTEAAPDPDAQQVDIDLEAAGFNTADEIVFPDEVEVPAEVAPEPPAEPAAEAEAATAASPETAGSPEDEADTEPPSMLARFATSLGKLVPGREERQETAAPDHRDETISDLRERLARLEGRAEATPAAPSPAAPSADEQRAAEAEAREGRVSVAARFYQDRYDLSEAEAREMAESQEAHTEAIVNERVKAELEPYRKFRKESEERRQASEEASAYGNGIAGGIAALVRVQGADGQRSTERELAEDFMGEMMRGGSPNWNSYLGQAIRSRANELGSADFLKSPAAVETIGAALARKIDQFVSQQESSAPTEQSTAQGGPAPGRRTRPNQQASAEDEQAQKDLDETLEHMGIPEGMDFLDPKRDESTWSM